MNNHYSCWKYLNEQTKILLSQYFYQIIMIFLFLFFSLLATTSADRTANIYRISDFDNTQITPTQHISSPNLK